MPDMEEEREPADLSQKQLWRIIACSGLRTELVAVHLREAILKEHKRHKAVTYFLHLQYPAELRYPNEDQCICSRREKDGVVYFNYTESLSIKLKEGNIWSLWSQSFVYKLFYRVMGHKTPIQVGSCSVPAKSLLLKDTLELHERVPIDGKATLELSLSFCSPRSICESRWYSKSAQEESQKLETIAVPKSKKGQKVDGNPNDQNASGESQTLLRCLLHIPDGIFSDCNNLYVSVKLFCNPQTFMSNMSWSDQPQFNFVLECPVLLNRDLLVQVQNKIQFVEVWHRNPSSSVDHLLGITSLHLHSFFLSFSEPSIVSAVQKLKQPVVAADRAFDVFNPCTGGTVGTLKITLALGTPSQIARFQKHRCSSHLTALQQESAEEEEEESGESLNAHLSLRLDTVTGVCRQQDRTLKAYLVYTMPSLGLAMTGQSETMTVSDEIAFKYHRVHRISSFIDEPLLFSVYLKDEEEEYMIAKGQLDATNIRKCLKNKQSFQFEIPLIAESRTYLDGQIKLSGSIEAMKISNDSKTIVQISDRAVQAEEGDIINKTHDPDSTDQDTRLQYESIKEKLSELKSLKDTWTALQPDLNSVGNRRFKLPESRVSRHTNDAVVSQSPLRCQLNIVIENAMHLNQTPDERSVAPSTYARVEISEDQFIQTELRKNSYNPVWNHAGTADVPHERLQHGDADISVKLYSVNDEEKSQMLGATSVDLSPLLAGMNTISGWYKLKDEDGNAAGYIKVAVSPKDVQQLHDLRPFISEPSLFLAPKDEEKAVGALKDLLGDLQESMSFLANEVEKERNDFNKERIDPNKGTLDEETDANKGMDEDRDLKLSGKKTPEYRRWQPPVIQELPQEISTSYAQTLCRERLHMLHSFMAKLEETWSGDAPRNDCDCVCHEDASIVSSHCINEENRTITAKPAFTLSSDHDGESYNDDMVTAIQKDLTLSLISPSNSSSRQSFDSHIGMKKTAHSPSDCSNEAELVLEADVTEQSGKGNHKSLTNKGDQQPPRDDSNDVYEDGISWLPGETCSQNGDRCGDRAVEGSCNNTGQRRLSKRLAAALFQPQDH